MQKEYAKKVLLIKLSSLGDVIFNIPLANALKNAGYTVSWLVSEKGAAVLENNPCVDEVILAPFEKWKKNNFFKNLQEFFALKKLIKEKEFDIVIDTQGRWRSLVFTIFSGIKRRLVGSDSKEFSRFGSNEIVKVPSKNDWSLNVVKKYLLFAEYLGIKEPEIKMSLPPSSEQDINKINEFLKESDTQKPLMVVCPATTWETKHWDKDNWKELISKIDDRYNIVFTGTAKDTDYIEYINSEKHLNLAGKTSLKELIELFRRSDVVISLDSGSTHLAAASNSKCIISIYCSTPKSYYAPIGENHIALSGNLPCQFCHKRKCKLKNNKNACTKLPTVDEVLKIIAEL